MLKLKVVKTDYFYKLVKNLTKKYRNIENDIDDFLDNIDDLKDLGIPLGHNIYKARIKNTDNNKGKSGGYRLITYLQLKENELTLIYIYSKSELENISESVLDNIIINTI
ncbi:MAG: type II toxin-antitoxin system RelE/ParE family toxin [Bacteroidota bacterium]